MLTFAETKAAAALNYVLLDAKRMLSEDADGPFQRSPGDRYDNAHYWGVPTIKW